MQTFLTRSLLAAIFVSIVTTAQNSKIALIIVDVQHCFLPGGSLAVTDGDHVIPVINDIRRNYKEEFSLVVLSKDWHCPHHVSFASAHNGYKPYDVIPLTYFPNGTRCTDKCAGDVISLNQTLWPDHCILNTSSADIDPKVHMEVDDVIVKKGYHCQVDSYSAFFSNGDLFHTELHDTLQAAKITTLIVTGLALDFCVYYTSKDAKTLGYETYVVHDATRPVFQEQGVIAVNDMKSKGILVINYQDLKETFQQIKDRDTSGTKHSQAMSFAVWISLPLLYFLLTY